jgi:hypothetical protein
MYTYRYFIMFFPESRSPQLGRVMMSVHGSMKYPMTAVEEEEELSRYYHTNGISR